MNEPWEVDDVPASAWCRRRNRYGSVPGLDDEELADPDELERQALHEEWGPVLRLPVRGRGGFRPEIDEDGVEFGAFASVDFKRTMPEFDKARYKADKLREELRDTLILLSIVKRRLPGKAKYLVLKYLRMAVIELEHVADDDMLALAKFYLRARRLRDEIRDLEEASTRKQRAALATVLR